MQTYTKLPVKDFRGCARRQTRDGVGERCRRGEPEADYTAALRSGANERLTIHPAHRCADADEAARRWRVPNMCTCVA